MDRSLQEFCPLVGAVLTRFFVQNAQPQPSAAEIAGFSARLWALVIERGLPPPLTPGDAGAPKEISETECAPLVARVVGDATNPLLADAARQLVKTCFYPEFKTCRESYRAVTPDGVCRRQELVRARKRVSGSHCVDCPYWQELEPAAHAEFLGKMWCPSTGSGLAAGTGFAEHRDIFLPEDFRALRRWVRARASRPG
jgi:hypothetical protein